MKSIIPSQENLLKIDYKYAVLNILWHRDGDVRNIIFANIELLPNEHPEPIALPESSKRIGNKGQQYFYFRRIVDSAENLINLYEDLALRKMQPITFWQENKEDFEYCNYSLEPLYPIMSLTKDPVYLPDFSGSIRTSFLFNQAFSSEIKKVCLDEKYLSWINKNLNFNISEHQEYFGAILMSAYNPLIRKVHHRGGGNDIPNVVYFDIEPRNNINISDLELLFIEKRPKGFSSFVKHKLTKNILTIKTIQEIDQTGYAIICPKRGLLDWHEFCGSAEINVNVKNKDYTKTEETYTVQRYSKTPGIEINDVEQDDVLKFLHHIEIQKNKNKKINTQKTFYNDEKAAAEFVRELIGKAREKVVIIDPYLSTRELFKYPLSITTSVEIILITSKVGLNIKTKQINESLKMNETDILKQQLETLKEKHGFNINAYVMTGHDPIFHDRFLIIDNDVWLSGNSLADLGKRISTIVKLPNSKEIIEIFNGVIADSEKICNIEAFEEK